MPTPDPFITTPWQDISYAANQAVIVKEISGTAITSGALAIAAIGIRKGSQHPDNPLLFCADPVAAALGPRNFWRVTYSFATFGGSNDPNQLAQLPSVLWRPGLYSSPTDRDLDGNPIQNSALSLFDPPHEREYPYLSVVVTRYESTPFDVARALGFIGRVNSNEFQIQGHTIPEGQCLCRNISPTAAYTIQDPIIQVEYEFELRAEGYDIELFDVGLSAWRSTGRGGNKKTTEIYRPPDTDNGETTYVQISGPVRLNGKGKPIIDTLVTRTGQSLVELDTRPKGATFKSFSDDAGLTAVSLTYKWHKRVDFSTLGI